MHDVLMTICTYDDREVAERDAARLREAGIKAVVAPCLLEDPDQPNVPLFDVVLHDADLARAQELLGTAVLDEPAGPDPAVLARADRWFWSFLGMMVAGTLVLLALMYRPR